MKRSSRILVLAGSVLAMAAVATPTVAQDTVECINECFNRALQEHPGRCGPKRVLICTDCVPDPGCGCARLICCDPELGACPDAGCLDCVALL